ncbi:hypothetical protein ACWGNN_35745 [Streptomyces sp. NPDC055817]
MPGASGSRTLASAGADRIVEKILGPGGQAPVRGAIRSLAFRGNSSAMRHHRTPLRHHSGASGQATASCEPVSSVWDSTWLTISRAVTSRSTFRSASSSSKSHNVCDRPL